MRLLFLFLLISTAVKSQTILTVDSLMLSNAIHTKTQLICNTSGEQCKPEIIWTYDTLGLLTSKETFRNDSLIEKNRYEYNEQYLATKVFTTYYSGKEFLNIKYSYSPKYKLTTFEACTPNGKCEPFETYTYSPAGKLQTRTRFKDGKYFYEYKHKYDSKGNNTEILILSKDSDSGERERKTYDKNNRHINSKWIDYKGEEIDNAEYSYDSAGRLIKNAWIGGLSTQKLYEYDHNGNNTKYTSIDYNNQIDDLRVMTFDQNLITSRIKYNGKKIESYSKFEYTKW